MKYLVIGAFFAAIFMGSAPQIAYANNAGAVTFVCVAFSEAVPAKGFTVNVSIVDDKTGGMNEKGVSTTITVPDNALKDKTYCGDTGYVEANGSAPTSHWTVAGSKASSGAEKSAGDQLFNITTAWNTVQDGQVQNQAIIFNEQTKNSTPSICKLKVFCGINEVLWQGGTQGPVVVIAEFTEASLRRLNLR